MLRTKTKIEVPELIADIKQRMSSDEFSALLRGFMWRKTVKQIKAERPIRGRK